MDHGELGLGRGIICCLPVDDIVHLFELLAREEEAKGQGSDKVCGMRSMKALLDLVILFTLERCNERKHDCCEAERGKQQISSIDKRCLEIGAFASNNDER